jgi:DNA modification methylase
MKLIKGDSLDVMRKMGSESVHLIVTSPPYYKKRSYGSSGKEIGNEESVSEYLTNLLYVFTEALRVLRNDGAMFIVIQDSYVNGKLALIPDKLKLKFSEIAILRQDLIWAKPNPRPESALNRFVTAHEHILFVVKNKKYFFDPFTLQKIENLSRRPSSVIINKKNFDGSHGAGFPENLVQKLILSGSPLYCCSLCKSPFYHTRKEVGRHPKPTKQMILSGANANGKYEGTSKNPNMSHRENPSDLKRRILDRMAIIWEYEWTPSCCDCIGHREKAIVLDPFCGHSTVGKSALQLGRDFIGIDLYAENIQKSKLKLKGLW